MGATQPLVLIGLMGAGKSTLAGTLASRFGVRAVDTDAMVEARAGRSIAAIFAQDGEPTFRALEQDAVVAALADAQFDVVSLGGGAFMTPGVRAACEDARVVYLHAAPKTLAARLSGDDSSTRPLLSSDVAVRLAALYAERDPVYRTATHVVETDGVEMNVVVDTLWTLMNVDRAECADRMTE